MATKKANEVEMSVVEIQEGELTCCILGTAPFICNRMSQKVLHELLAPQKKTAADKAASMKHNPLQEFRDSPYRLAGDNPETVLAVLPSMFKQAMGTAALRTPGAQKTAVLQLVNVPWANMPIYGIPKVFMAVTRSADMNKTPDVRTRAIIPEWAVKLTVRFTKPIIREQSVMNLLAAAGRISGVGDWRQEKGSGSYGSFKLVSADDPDFVRITKTMGYEAQDEALENPQAYNDETDEMLAWYDVELKRRGFKVVA